MKRGDFPLTLGLAQTYAEEAGRRARFGEWGMVGIAVTRAYLELKAVAKALEFDLETEARKLQAEEKSHV